MRLVTFDAGAGERLGVVADDRVIDIAAAAEALHHEALPSAMLQLLQGGDALLERVRTLLATVSEQGNSQNSYSYGVAAVRLRAPLPQPGKIICVGQNYRDHVLEQNAEMPERPILFAKFNNAIVGPGDDVIYPTTTSEFDYEAELVVVIGKQGKHINSEQAYEYVAGYMTGQDVTARDLQRGDKQWVRGKTQDTTAPTGPYLVTRDEVPDPQTLDIKLWVNGTLLQDSNTSNLIFNVPFLLEFISQGITLMPGDLIYTGTPPGVGVFRKPQALLKVGDEMSVEVQGLGRLTNRVVSDPHGA